MTIARAPGKVVLSGAYSVLHGAPALVAAVGRDAVADGSRAPDRITEEVAAAIEVGVLSRACAFDASALRTDGGARKLGLGSSAAILVATMAAVDGVPVDDAGRHALVDRARRAHRAGQGGGSGVDVAATTLGGVLACRIDGDALHALAHTLPPDVAITILTSAAAASTPGMLGLVRAYAAREPAPFALLLEAAREGAVEAALAQSATALVDALTAQRGALGEIGRLAGAPIVTPEVALVARAAADLGAYVGPAGAGGGDVAIVVGPRTLDLAPLLDLAALHGLLPLDASLGAPGVSAIGPSDVPLLATGVSAGGPGDVETR